MYYYNNFGFPGGSDSKASACSAGDPGLIPGLGRSPGEGNGNPLQDYCLGNPMDGGAWWAAVHHSHPYSEHYVCPNWALSEKKVKSLSRVRLCDPMDCSLPGSSVHGIFQARIQEWVAIWPSLIPKSRLKELLIRELSECRNQSSLVAP